MGHEKPGLGYNWFMQITGTALKYLVFDMDKAAWKSLRRPELGGRVELNYITADPLGLSVNLTAFVGNAAEAWKVEISGPISPETGEFLGTPNQKWTKV